jgi:hypothetical protein
MRDMMNVAFQNAWFGPYMIPNVYAGSAPEELPAGPVYNSGPMDGLLEASMHAQWFAQIPLVNPYQATPRMSGRTRKLGAQPTFCPPGQVPVQTGVPGESKCIAWSAPSAMITGEGPNTVSKTTPPHWPTARTFPVRPFYGFEES